MSPTAPSPTPPPTATWRPLNTLSTPRCRPSTPPATSRWPAPDYNPAPRKSWPPSIVNGTAWSRTATSRCCPWTTTPPNGRCALPSWAAKTSAAPVPAGLPNSPPASGPSPPPPTSPASTPSPTSPPTSTPAAPPAAHPSPQPTCNASCPGQPAPPIWPPGLPHHATITPPPPKQPSTRNRYTPRNPGCPSARPSCDSRILTAKQRLDKSVESIAKLGKMMDMRVAPEYHLIRLREIELTGDYQFKAQEEREATRAERERLREEKRAEAELQTERERLEKERNHYTNALAKLAEQGNQEQADELRERLSTIDDAIAQNDYRIANIRAGYVYVISNLGAFGEN